MEVSGQLLTQAALPQGKTPPYTSDRRLDGSQSRSERGGEEKNSGESNLRTPIVQPSRYTDRTITARRKYTKGPLMPKLCVINNFKCEFHINNI
jgi:hypothetical protein